NDIRDLLGFETLQASGLSITRTLASAVDAQVQAPGPALIFTRSFGTDISQHFALGRFGYGWSDNWDYSLQLASDGTVTIFDLGGEHVLSSVNYRNETNSYAYSIGVGAAREHALTQAVKPDTTTQNYTHYPNGRLASRSGCCGAVEPVNYTYDSAGMVAATDE